MTKRWASLVADSGCRNPQDEGCCSVADPMVGRAPCPEGRAGASPEGRGVYTYIERSERIWLVVKWGEERTFFFNCTLNFCLRLAFAFGAFAVVSGLEF